MVSQPCNTPEDELIGSWQGIEAFAPPLWTSSIFPFLSIFEVRTNRARGGSGAIERQVEAKDAATSMYISIQLGQEA